MSDPSNVSQSATGTGKIDPFASRDTTDHKILEVGYKCKVHTVETRPDEEIGGYSPSADYVIWTYLENEKGQPIWAVYTELWGTIYVGYVETKGANPVGRYLFSQVFSFDTWEEKGPCNKKETIVLPSGGHLEVQMTLPAIGFGRGDTDSDNPLNFELLESLGFRSVVSNERKDWFWARSPYNSFLGQNLPRNHRIVEATRLHAAWAFHSVDGRINNFYRRRYFANSVRCIGL